MGTKKHRLPPSTQSFEEEDGALNNQLLPPSPHTALCYSTFTELAYGTGNRLFSLCH